MDTVDGLQGIATMTLLLDMGRFLNRACSTRRIRYMKLMILTMVLAFSGAGFAQTVSPEKALSPLSYYIGLENVDKNNRSLTLKLRIRNTSRGNVIIDKRAVRYQVIFRRKG